ncbi:MAG: hypothetical protein ACYSUI_22660, partial [Planctomycetota bacterium]
MAKIEPHRNSGERRRGKSRRRGTLSSQAPKSGFARRPAGADTDQEAGTIDDEAENSSPLFVSYTATTR